MNRLSSTMAVLLSISISSSAVAAPPLSPAEVADIESRPSIAARARTRFGVGSSEPGPSGTTASVSTHEVDDAVEAALRGMGGRPLPPPDRLDTDLPAPQTDGRFAALLSRRMSFRTLPSERAKSERSLQALAAAAKHRASALALGERRGEVGLRLPPGQSLRSGAAAHPAVDLDRAGIGMAPVSGQPEYLDAVEGARPQVSKHRVNDRLADGAGGAPDPEVRHLDRVYAFPRLAPVSPSTLFRPLPSRRQTTALATRGDRVLVGTTGGLVSVRDDGSDRRDLLAGVPIHGLSFDMEDADAAMVATDRGLFRYQGGELTRVLDAATTSVLPLPEQGILLTGHRHGVLQWLVANRHQRLTKVQTRAPLRHLMVHDHRVFCGNGEGLWSVDSDGKVQEERLSSDPLTHPVTWLGVHGDALYVGTPGGLFRRVETGWRRVGPALHVLGAASLDGLLYVGTDGRGTWLLEDGALEEVPLSLRSAVVFAATPRSLLIGTVDSGVARVWWVDGEPQVADLYPLDDGPPGNQIVGLAFAPGSKQLFVGTYDHGVGRLGRDGGWSHLGTTTGIPSLWTNEVAADAHRVLVRVSDGRVAESRDGNRFQVRGPETGWPKTWTSVVGKAEQDVFVGTHGGYYLGADEGYDLRFPVPALEGKMVVSGARRDGRTYLGTHKSGLFVQPEPGAAWRQFSVATGLPDSWIVGMTWFRGNLWLATFNAGVAVLPKGDLDPKGWVFTRSAEGSLPSDHIRCLLVTDRELWIGTQGGLSRYDGATWVNFRVEDGLPDDAITALASDGTTLWVGTGSCLVEASLTGLRQEVARQVVQAQRADGGS